MLRAEILANRQKVITFLKQPNRIKATGKLDRGNGARCCLGHMCYALELPRTSTVGGGGYGYGKLRNNNYAPEELMKLLGFYTYDGRLRNNQDIKIPTLNEAWFSLAELNDQTTCSPQQIGTYLESVIEGGNNTPWKPLTDYPETL